MSLIQLDFTHTLGLLFLLIGSKVLWELFWSPLSVFPGPFAAKFTDVWRALAVVLGQVDNTNRKWHRKYGSAVRVGPNAVLLNDPGLIKTIYSTKQPWEKSDMYMVNDVVVNGKRIANIFNARDHAWHAQQLKPISKFFSMSKLMDVEPLMDETINKFVAQLDEKFFKGSSSGGPCKMDEWLAYLAWDTMANVTFGRHYGFVDQGLDVDGLISDSVNGLRYFAPVSQIPWIDYLLDKNPFMRIGPKPQLMGLLYATRAIAEYKQELAEKGSGNQHVPHLLDKYLRLEEQYPEMVNDNQLVIWLLPTVVAGGDTTAASLRAVVYYLAKNPEVKRKLCDELDNAKLNMPAQWKDLKELVYLDAVIRESMRICPGIAMAPERVVPKGGHVLSDGRCIPAGTKVGINPAVTNRDAGVFGEDVDRFIPERWIQQCKETDEDFGQRFRRMHDVLEYDFGGGTRVCLGKNLAKLEIYKVTATLYSRYDRSPEVACGWLTRADRAGSSVAVQGVEFGEMKRGSVPFDSESLAELSVFHWSMSRRFNP
ncbi:Cytochrome P450 [Fusarium albosuccineum]|uniref:Cytochrome P450 n=1 Tax=Fusarium albosuccineum TaxID=1237068 RepID=A0A8H4P6K5_9HYPO|nr:Cytochrome P450 [Fusarium albosuccineum]